MVLSDIGMSARVGVKPDSEQDRTRKRRQLPRDDFQFIRSLFSTHVNHGDYFQGRDSILLRWQLNFISPDSVPPWHDNESSPRQIWLYIFPTL